MGRNSDSLLYGVTICCGSILLFSVQPIIAKAILPRFGGSAGVWVTCVLFFQIVLLLGYLYAYWTTRHLNRKAQTTVHLAVLTFSVCELPLNPSVRWVVSGTEHPVVSILFLLTMLVGLPYFLLSTSSPLLQVWYAGSSGARFPYWLFALSNSASLLALLAYPVGIEPFLSERQQLRGWSGAYLGFVLLASISALRNRSKECVDSQAAVGGAVNCPLAWIALTACASTLWLGVANHLSHEVAAIPFLWVLPLSLYLLSFILCFERNGWYRPLIFRWLLPAAWIAVCYRIALQGSVGGLQWEIPVFSAALFTCCMFCHGELARMKPEPRQGLAFFYLMIALGGALGAIFVGFVAPNVFSTYLELPIGIAACIFLGLVFLYRYNSPKQLARLGVVALLTFAFATHFRSGGKDVVHVRNFYGTLQVSDFGTGEIAVRSLYNGKTLHGLEFLSPARSRLATTYYGAESGVGLVLQSYRTSNQRVGIIGLGVGTLATYGRRGDYFRFYEINPAVIQVASQHFRFLRESEAKTDVVIGDGRLAFEREAAKSFNVIILDAFSGDSIPVHLLTREAFEVYFHHLSRGGILAVHITNRYLDLASIVVALAEALQKRILLVHNLADVQRQICAADWALLSDNREALRNLDGFSDASVQARKVRLWTDDYSNLFQILK